MVAVARLSGQNGKSMETFVQNFQNWRLVVPMFSAWGFGQIWKKTWLEFFSFGHVTNPRWRRNADSGKRLGQNFFEPDLTSDWLSWLPTPRSSSSCRLGDWPNLGKDLPRIFQTKDACKQQLVFLTTRCSRFFQVFFFLLFFFKNLLRIIPIYNGCISSS